MLYNFNSYFRIRKPHKFIAFLHFHTFVCGNSGQFNGQEVSYYFLENPLACIGLVAYYSSFLSRTSFASSRGQPAGKGEIDETNDGYGRFRQMGSWDNGDQQDSSFDKFDEAKEFEDDDDDKEVGEDGDGDDDDDDFMVLNSFNRNGEQREDIGRVELDEDEIRHPLVREICRLIELSLVWNPKLEGELRHLLRSLKPRQVCAVLRSQADERVALKLFYWADRQWRYRHDPIVYYTMLEVLSKTKLCQGARRVLQLMACRGIVCRPEAFGYVILSYSRAGKLRNAMQILTLMQRAGVDPDLSICNTAINVLVKGNKLEKALRFLARMQLVEITPNVVTYNSLIKGYCDVHCVEDAIELIAEMPLKGCYPDKVSYYTVMSFLCKEKRVKEVRKLMDKMVKDSKLILDQVTYNSLIHMLSKHGHGDEALEFLREAEERGFRVDKVGYSAIVHSFCKPGRIDIAKELVNEMFKKGCIPDVVTYTVTLLLMGFVC